MRGTPKGAMQEKSDYGVPLQFDGPTGVRRFLPSSSTSDQGLGESAAGFCSPRSKDTGGMAARFDELEVDGRPSSNRLNLLFRLRMPLLMRTSHCLEGVGFVIVYEFRCGFFVGTWNLVLSPDCVTPYRYLWLASTSL